MREHLPGLAEPNTLRYTPQVCYLFKQAGNERGVRAMTMQSLLTIGIFIVALPLLGVMLAMALGIVITLSRRAGGISAIDALEPPLRRAAATFGYAVEGVRKTPDRRIRERRARPRQRHPRSGVDRRDCERRMLDRRARDRRHERLAMGGS